MRNHCGEEGSGVTPFCAFKPLRTIGVEELEIIIEKPLTESDASPQRWKYEKDRLSSAWRRRQDSGMLLEDRIPRTFARVVRNIGPFDSVAWIDEQQQERIQVGPFEPMHDTRRSLLGRGALTAARTQ